MVKKLIINADDFGLCDGVTFGILKAHQDGILTSTTCMMNMPHIEEYLSLASHFPHLGLGVHLVLTIGKPLTRGSFCDEKGNFKSRNMYPGKKVIVKQDELYLEWKTQIDKFIQLTNKKPTHLDSHHHVHLLPGNIDVALKLAKEYDIPLRQECYLQNDFEYVRFSEVFYNQSVSLETINDICHFDDEIFELMCHPAFVDPFLYNHSSYNIQRIKELDILCSQEAKDITKNIQLINYGQIKKRP